MPPRDEAQKDPLLAELVRRIGQMSARRDFRGLESLMAADFRVEFDAGKGPKAFHAHWRPESPSSPLWRLLPRLTSIGGTFYSETLFALPYVYTRFPFDLSLVRHVVALKHDVSLLDKPEAGGNRVATLSYSIVPLADPLQPPVFLDEGSYLRVGGQPDENRFVAASDVYSPAGHRAFFEKRHGQWRWISLAAATLKEPPVPRGDLKR